MEKTMLKGSNIQLDNVMSGDINQLFVGVGWNDKDKEQAHKIDISAFFLTENNKVRNNDDFIFYNQPNDKNHSIVLLTDPLNNHDQQGFSLSFPLIPSEVSKIVFCVTIDEVESQDSIFNSINNLYIRLLDGTFLGQELINYQISDTGLVKALMCAQLYRHNKNWKFKAVGQGFNGGLGALANHFNVTVNSVSEEVEQETVGLKHKRRSSQDILDKHAVKMRSEVVRIIPQVDSATKNKINESNTRMLVDRILMDVLGYDIDEIKAEQNIEGRRADYVLSVGNKDSLVVEVKRAGLPLKDQHIFQATSYGIFSGIEWVLLTNLREWKLFKIISGSKVKADHLFTVTINDDFDKSMNDNFALISKVGMERPSLLFKAWNKVNALSDSNVINAILSPEVLAKIKSNIKRESSISVEIESIQNVVEKLLHVD
jgi:stress response protein SCP2/predicted type IV restriction endonuclease